MAMVRFPNTYNVDRRPSTGPKIIPDTPDTPNTAGVRAPKVIVVEVFFDLDSWLLDLDSLFGPIVGVFVVDGLWL